MSGKFLITGATTRSVEPGAGAQSGPSPRLEINKFVSDENKWQFALYVQALNEMFKDTDSIRSFYEVSGIHGKPFRDWNQSPSRGRGYCVHGTDQFIPWHRPYIALFEQLLYEHAAAIAERYTTDVDEWKNATASLRQPYWDWAKQSVPPDRVIRDKTVTIPVPPNGDLQSVDNPFFQYTFKRGERENGEFIGTFSRWSKTLRHPTTTRENAESNVESLRIALQSLQEELTELTEKLATRRTWPEFSSALENIHNKVHVRVGGANGGHMSQVPYAAFDPIFYLHHAQVDRLASLWNRQHKLWITRAADLNPFWSDQQTYWKSDSISQTASTFNYSYDDIPEGSTAPSQTARSIKPALDAPAAEASGPRTTITDWSVRVHCKRFEVGGSFSVLLFLGEVPNGSEVPATPEEWYYASNLAGSFDVFANSEANECGNCRDREDIPIEGHVYINRAILKQHNGNSLDPTTVVPLLEAKLNWVVLKVGGGIVELPSLEVVVQATPLTFPVPSEGAIPSAGEPVSYPEVTRGRSGGSR
ncbi:hypothetical protein AX16_002861 [Volvariella volvacea WC 439]|nr:hypothetical protein AX16_002861 [Volvariella volvacea WC 439]